MIEIVSIVYHNLVSSIICLGKIFMVMVSSSNFFKLLGYSTSLICVMLLFIFELIIANFAVLSVKYRIKIQNTNTEAPIRLVVLCDLI